MKDVKGTIKSYLENVLRNKELKDDESFFESGVINSLFAMQLVLFIEKEFEISVDNDELSLDNFLTINKITEYIEAKLD
jgi:acyl carrier protein